MTFGMFLFWSLMVGCLSGVACLMLHGHLPAKVFKIWLESSIIVVIGVGLLILWCLHNDGVLVKVSASEQVKNLEAIEAEILAEEIGAVYSVKILSGLPRRNIRVISKEGEVIFERKDDTTISKQDDRISIATGGNVGFGVTDRAPIAIHVADDDRELN